MREAQTERGESRDMPRWVSGEGASILSNGALHPCTVLDISASGVKLRYDTELSVGDEVDLRLPGILPLRLRIVRVQPDHAAAAFVDGPHYLFR